MIEILAPAGDEKSAYTAIDSGANAIYLGLSAFSARSSAANFDWEQLEKLIARAHLFGVKIYVAMNTLVKDGELEEFVSSAVRVHNLGADAIILQDAYLGAYLKETYPQLCLHLSTQAGVCNAYGAKFAKECGFSRVILARETAFEDVCEIAKIIETEVFVQGALCTCFSGQCYMSSFAGGNSGNRGKCKQPCRKRYRIDREGFDDYAYRLSLSDLCLAEDALKFAQAGVTSFKIEGRMRRPEYVAAAVRYYKGIFDGCATDGDLSALKRTYNRGNYTKGLAFGQPRSLISAAVQGHIGEYVGTVGVENGKYFCRTHVRCGTGDGFKILRDGTEVCGATFKENVKGGFILASSTRLKNGDKVFITTDAALNSHLIAKPRTVKIVLTVTANAGERLCVAVNGESYISDFAAERATARPLTAEDIKTCFSKVDKYPFSVAFESVSTDGNAFVPLSLLNGFRRDVYYKLYAALTRVDIAPIDNIKPLPKFSAPCKNTLTAVVATDLNGVSADIGILKPNDCNADLSALCKRFVGQKFLYMPPYVTGAELQTLKPLIAAFDGIYCGGNYAIPLAKELGKKLFYGLGGNLFNRLSVDRCGADYIALSKELSLADAQPLARANSFYLTGGDIKVMDLIYCPFGRTCARCDRRDVYTLTDEWGRVFPLRRYSVSQCRFEVFNCARLAVNNTFTGSLYDLSTCRPDGFDCDGDMNKFFPTRTKGHGETSAL